MMDALILRKLPNKRVLTRARAYHKYTHNVPPLVERTLRPYAKTNPHTRARRRSRGWCALFVQTSERVHVF
ncbi:hypothetical protein KSX_25580 [Ktedonospora formicarum]|uniref:Uncharacterized protein n=1 Tax=Ktedonospora formicarum TaxID=2778364 RepID=A0A8J3MQW7_9CHLR|nr:hypothetical protein KSX_25580 [Ktedonospora formicarum]